MIIYTVYMYIYIYIYIIIYVLPFIFPFTMNIPQLIAVIFPHQHPNGTNTHITIRLMASMGLGFGDPGAEPRLYRNRPGLPRATSQMIAWGPQDSDGQMGWILVGS